MPFFSTSVLQTKWIPIFLRISISARTVSLGRRKEGRNAMHQHAAGFIGLVGYRYIFIAHPGEEICTAQPAGQAPIMAILCGHGLLSPFLSSGFGIYCVSLQILICNETLDLIKSCNESFPDKFTSFFLRSRSTLRRMALLYRITMIVVPRIRIFLEFPGAASKAATHSPRNFLLSYTALKIMNCIREERFQ